MDIELEFQRYRNMKRIGGEYNMAADKLGFIRYTPILPVPAEEVALGDQPTPTPEEAIKKAISIGPETIKNGLIKVNNMTFDMVERKMIDSGLDEKSVKKIMKSIKSGQEEVVNTVYDIMVPQTPEDIALTAAVGPVAKLRKPAAAVAGALFGAGTTETQADKVGE